MLETLFTLAQAPRLNHCTPTVPVVVCVRFQVRYPPEAKKPSEYYIKLTNGSSEMRVNRCTYWGNPVGARFKYVPDQKWCPDEP